MNLQLLKQQLGWDRIVAFFTKPARVSPLFIERKKFEDDVREQFLSLKKKGISIPVFTL